MPSAELTRNSVRGLRLAYAGGVGLSALPGVPGLIRRRPG